MQKRSITLVLLLTATLLVHACNAAPASSTSEPVPTYLGETLPGEEPALFRAGSVSTGAVELSLAVHPNLQEIYFVRLEAGRGTILVSRADADGWTEPEPVPFSGSYSDVNPFLRADGQALYFSSDRPLDDNPGGAYHLWVAEWTGDGWSDPAPLSLPVRSAGDEMSPSLTLDGTLYFLADYPDLGGAGLYRSILMDGVYQLPEKQAIMEAVDGIVEVEPFIAPDESFMLFYSAGRTDNLTPGDLLGDLYISFRDGQGNWSEPQNLGVSVNSSAEESTPTLSPDGRFLFFASNRDAANHLPDIYWMDAGFLRMLRQG